MFAATVSDGRGQSLCRTDLTFVKTEPSGSLPSFILFKCTDVNRTTGSTTGSKFQLVNRMERHFATKGFDSIPVRHSFCVLSDTIFTHTHRCLLTSTSCYEAKKKNRTPFEIDYSNYYVPNWDYWFSTTSWFFPKTCQLRLRWTILKDVCLFIYLFMIKEPMRNREMIGWDYKMVPGTQYFLLYESCGLNGVKSENK